MLEILHSLLNGIAFGFGMVLVFCVAIKISSRITSKQEKEAMSDYNYSIEMASKRFKEAEENKGPPLLFVTYTFKTLHGGIATGSATLQFGEPSELGHLEDLQAEIAQIADVPESSAVIILSWQVMKPRDSVLS